MSREWVLLRGLAREQGHWGEFKTKLQDANPQDTITCVDLPGTGKFHRLSSPMSIAGIAEFVVSQLEPKTDKRILVTISLGSMVAVEMLYLHPEIADGVVLINPSFRNLSPALHRLQLDALPHMYRAATAGSQEDRERAVLAMVSNRGDRDRYTQEWAEIGRKNPIKPQTFFKQLIAAATYDLPEQKPNIPVLLLSSEADRMVDPRCSKTLAEKWGLEVVSHPTAGHELCLDEADWTVAQINKFFSP